MCRIGARAQEVQPLGQFLSLFESTFSLVGKRFEELVVCVPVVGCGKRPDLRANPSYIIRGVSRLIEPLTELPQPRKVFLGKEPVRRLSGNSPVDHGLGESNGGCDR